MVIREIIRAAKCVLHFEFVAFLAARDISKKRENSRKKKKKNCRTFSIIFHFILFFSSTKKDGTFNFYLKLKYLSNRSLNYKFPLIDRSI